MNKHIPQSEFQTPEVTTGPLPASKKVYIQSDNFEDVKVPKENVFPDIRGLRGPLSCLSKARYGISWGAIGAAMDCYDSALRYSQERTQFGKPIGAFQLQQKKLAENAVEGYCGTT